MQSYLDADLRAYWQVDNALATLFKEQNLD